MSRAAQVPAALYYKTRFVMSTRPLWLALARLESRVLADDLADVTIDRPVYVTGLARAGTTIVTEMLAESEQLTSHTYGDFPFIFTPFWRNWLAQRSRVANPVKSQRAHADRIEISLDSPEAFEEVLWMAFDRALHTEQSITPVAADQAPAGFT